MTAAIRRYDKIEAAKTLLRNAGYIVNLFHKSDILSCDETLTPDQVDEVASRLEDIDANCGISWDTIQIVADEVKAGR